MVGVAAVIAVVVVLVIVVALSIGGGVMLSNRIISISLCFKHDSDENYDKVNDRSI